MLYCLITGWLYFWPNKRRLGENKRLLKKLDKLLRLQISEGWCLLLFLYIQKMAPSSLVKPELCNYGPCSKPGTIAFRYNQIHLNPSLHLFAHVNHFQQLFIHLIQISFFLQILNGVLTQPASKRICLPIHSSSKDI